MPRWNTQTIIAEVDFSACRATTIGGDAWQAQIKAGTQLGTIGYSANRTPHRTAFMASVKGLQIGVSVPHAQASLIDDALDAIADAGTGTFRVQMIDALANIDADCWPNENQPWYQKGPESEGIIRDVVMLFVVVAQHVVIP